MKLKNKIFILFAIMISVTGYYEQISAKEISTTVDKIDVVKTSGSEGNFDQYEAVTINIDWSAKEQINDRDFFEVSIPSNLFAPNNTSFPVLDKNDNNLGQAVYDVATRKLKVTFNNKLQGLMNVKGTLQLNARLDISTSTTERPVDFVFDVDGTAHTVTVVVDPTIEVNPNELLFKGGTINEDITEINYFVRINYKKQQIDNAIITDTVGTGQIIDYDSIKVFKTDLDQFGSHISPPELLGADKYTLTNNGDTSFEVNLGSISESHLIVYKTKITDSTQTDFTNKAIFSGTQITEHIVEIVVLTTSGNGSGNGNLGKLEITKIDSTNSDLKLKNALFKLYNDKGILIKEFNTNENGTYVVTGLKYGQYKLVEIKAPNGYILDNKPRNVSISSTTKINMDVKNKKKTDDKKKTGPVKRDTPSNREIPKTGSSNLLNFTIILVITSTLVFYRGRVVKS